MKLIEELVSGGQFQDPEHCGQGIHLLNLVVDFVECELSFFDRVLEDVACLLGLLELALECSKGGLRTIVLGQDP